MHTSRTHASYRGLEQRGSSRARGCSRSGPVELTKGCGPQVADASLSADARRAHDDAVARGESSYVDPVTGFLVFTAEFLSERGRCCGSGCRHCPYDDDVRRAAGRPPMT